MAPFWKLSALQCDYMESPKQGEHTSLPFHGQAKSEQVQKLTEITLNQTQHKKKELGVCSAKVLLCCCGYGELCGASFQPSVFFFTSRNGFSFYYCTLKSISILVTLLLQLHFVFKRINISKTLSYCVVFGVLVRLFPLCINAAVFGLVSFVSLDERRLFSSISLLCISHKNICERDIMNYLIYFLCLHLIFTHQLLGSLSFKKPTRCCSCFTFCMSLIFKTGYIH